MLRRLWFFIKWTYIIWFIVLVFLAFQQVNLVIQGNPIQWETWDIMILGGIKYNWIIAMFCFVIEGIMQAAMGSFFHWASEPEPKPTRKPLVFPPDPEPEFVYGEVIEEMQTITAHSYNRLQLGSGPTKWVSDRLEDLRNGGLWTPKWVEKIMCPTCRSAQWASLLVDADGNWVKKYQCKACQTTFDSKGN
jgi:hypothetical protein